jgi:hypothetical protein
MFDSESRCCVPSIRDSYSTKFCYLQPTVRPHLALALVFAMVSFMIAA